MKRYYDYCDGDMRESDDGEWVRFEDASAELQTRMDEYMALKGELARKELALAQLQKQYAELKEGPPQYEQCSRCAGTGLSINMQTGCDERLLQGRDRLFRRERGGNRRGFGPQVESPLRTRLDACDSSDRALRTHMRPAIKHKAPIKGLWVLRDYQSRLPESDYATSVAAFCHAPRPHPTFPQSTNLVPHKGALILACACTAAPGDSSQQLRPNVTTGLRRPDRERVWKVRWDGERHKTPTDSSTGPPQGHSE